MSMKDGIEYAKTELTSDEKMLEGLFKFESFYKKYKKILFALLSILIIALIAKVTLGYFNDYKLTKANAALEKLLINPSDKAQLEILRENNIALYDLFSYKVAVDANDTAALTTLSKSSDELVADMSRYAVGAISGKPVDSTIYRELSLLEKASVAMSKNDDATARKILSSIPVDSPASDTAKLLEHQTISVPVIK